MQFLQKQSDYFSNNPRMILDFLCLTNNNRNMLCIILDAINETQADRIIRILL